jgi:hypothetical protein
MNIKTGISILFTTLVISLFTGFMISTAGAAMYPPLNKIAAPFVCSGGQMQVDEQTYYPAPGETVTTQTWTCVDNQTGQSRELGILGIAVFVIPIYAFIVFIPILILTAVWQILIRPASLKKQRATDLNTSMDLINKKFGNMSQEQRALMEQSVKNYYDKKSTDSSEKGKFIAQMDTANFSTHKPVEEQLKKLKELLDSELITKQDYEKKKAEILSKL